MLIVNWQLETNRFKRDSYSLLAIFIIHGGTFTIVVSRLDKKVDERRKKRG